MRRGRLIQTGMAAAMTLALCGCSRSVDKPSASASRPNSPDPLALALAPHPGSGPLDDQIRRLLPPIAGLLLRNGKALTDHIEKMPTEN